MRDGGRQLELGGRAGATGSPTSAPDAGGGPLRLDLLTDLPNPIG